MVNMKKHLYEEVNTSNKSQLYREISLCSCMQRYFCFKKKNSVYFIV